MKIAFVTGSRAEWGLLEKVYRQLAGYSYSPGNFFPILFVTGSHLSMEYGHTVDFINWPITEKIEIVLSGNSPSAVAKSMGLAMIGFGEAYERHRPDCVVVLGDRYESFCAVSAAHLASIRVAHIHGGEVTLGSLDNAFRHSMSMMSKIHFPAAKPYAERLRSFGLENIHCVGALGCEGLTKETWNPKSTGIMVAHYGDMDDLKQILRVFPRATVCVGSHDVKNGLIWDGKVVRLEREDFLRELSLSLALVGNSSAGIIEAPALGIPTINIGDRQKGRLCAPSIIPCPDVESLPRALETLHSDDFKALMESNYPLYYQGGNVSERIADVLVSEMRHAEH